jgi:hypothetical protein
MIERCRGGIRMSAGLLLGDAGVDRRDGELVPDRVVQIP